MIRIQSSAHSPRHAPAISRDDGVVSEASARQRELWTSRRSWVAFACLSLYACTSDPGSAREDVPDSGFAEGECQAKVQTACSYAIAAEYGASPSEDCTGCIESSCGDEAAACAGPGWRGLNLDTNAPCTSYYRCVAGCGCSDGPCKQACKPCLAASCASHIDKFHTCMATQCLAPCKLTGTRPDGGNATARGTLKASIDGVAIDLTQSLSAVDMSPTNVELVAITGTAKDGSILALGFETKLGVHKCSAGAFMRYQSQTLRYSALAEADCTITVTSYEPRQKAQGTFVGALPNLADEKARKADIANGVFDLTLTTE